LVLVAGDRRERDLLRQAGGVINSGAARAGRSTSVPVITGGDAALPTVTVGA
jgi:hypothetical protein